MFKIFLANWAYATHKKIFLCCVKTQTTQLNTNIIINKKKKYPYIPKFTRNLNQFISNKQDSAYQLKLEA